MELTIKTDPDAMDVDVIHDFLARQSTWAQGIPRQTLVRSLRHSLCFGGFLDQQQVAFARVITDHATFANLVDVFVLPAFRRRGYSKLLTAAVLAHPALQGLRRFTLATADAHGLYAQFGFKPLARPESFMELYQPDIYQQQVVPTP